MQMENYITLNTGAKMPVIGLGTWKSPSDKCGQAVEYALTDGGYRHIDCAAIYGNEKEIGNALKNVFESGAVNRDEVFITSKLWNTEHAKDDVEIACRKTLSDLQLEYLDLYLMHWGVAVPRIADESENPRGEPIDEQGVMLTANIPIRQTWEALEELVKKGLVRAIGVANFTGAMLIDLLSYAKIAPAVNQVELHPYNQQSRLIDFCHYKNIAVTGYSPLGSHGNMKERGGEPLVLEDEAVIAISRRCGKSPAQVLIRWALQRNTIVIPKSITPENIKNNISVFDFSLSGEDMNALAGLERHHRFVDSWNWWKIPYFD